jgi:hypothetical protein
MEDMIRTPGEFHEWLPTSRNLIFKEWGMTMEDIWRLRTPNKALHPLSTAPTKGWYHTAVGRMKFPPGSQDAHNALLSLVDTVNARFAAGRLKDPMRAYKRLLAGWTDDWMKNGTRDLPRGLGGTRPTIPLPTK